MRKKEIFDLLNKELEERVPELDSRILSTPIQQEQEKEIVSKESFGEKVKRVFSLKRTWAITASIALVLIVTILTLVLSPTINVPENNQSQYACYVIDINPSIVLTTDEKGNVVNVSSLNDDGNVLLNDIDINSEKSLEEYIQTIIENAMKLGYIDVSSYNNAVKLSVVSNVDQEEKINTAKTYIESTFMNNGVYGVVFAQGCLEEDFKKSLNLINEEESLYDFIKAYPKYTYMVGDLDEQINQTQIEIKQELVDTYREKIENFKSLLSEFIAINDELYESKGKDFFTIKDSPFLSEEIQAKVDRCKEIIDIFNEEYSFELNAFTLQRIESISEALSFVEKYLQIVDIEKIDVDVLIHYFELIFGRDSFASSNMDKIIENMPMDKNSFMSYESDKYKSKYDERINANLLKYEESREMISQQLYDDYIRTIIDTYGSIENYYNFLKNNQ